MSNRHFTKHRTIPKMSKLRGQCADGKLRYKDREMAIEALHRMQNASARAIELTGSTKRAEKRFYRCNKCNGFHMTSRETWQPTEFKEIA